MHIYRFRVSSEGLDDFLREIDIQSSGTFEDFFDALMNFTGLEKGAKGIFYITNNRWIRVSEIGIEPVKAKPRGAYDDDEDDLRDGIRKNRMPFTQMGIAKLRDFMSDPHQRIIFETETFELRIFYIELFKILTVNDDVSIPRCQVSRGEIPPKPIVIIPEIEDKPKRRVVSIVDEVAKIKLLDEITDDIIEEDIEELEEDETFGKIIKGQAPEPVIETFRKPRKQRATEIAEEFGPEFAEMLGSDDDDDEHDEAGEESEEMYGDIDEELGGGYQIKGGREDDYY
jgi:hypothetical protein